MTTSKKQYVFRITRFSCGCIYHTIIDDAVFCPEHRHSSPVGFITGQETIQMPGPGIPSIRQLAMNPHSPRHPVQLRSSERNSLHTESRTVDGQQEEWDRNRDGDETGHAPPA